MNTIDEMIEVLQAIKEGKDVESRELGVSLWQTRTAPATIAPNFEDRYYRVKKVPRTHWCVDYTTYWSGASAKGTTIFKDSQKANDFMWNAKSPAMGGMYTSVSEPYEVVEVMK